MEISVKKEQVQWRSHCRSSGELGMLATSGRRQASRFRWPNLMTAVPLQQYLRAPTLDAVQFFDWMATGLAGLAKTDVQTVLA